MHQFNTTGGPYEWAIDIFFNGDGTGSTTAGGEADVAFDYTEDMWIEVYCVIDLDNDLASMFVEGMNVRTWQWSLINNTGAAGLKALAAADFFPAAVDNPKYYMDNVYFKEAAHLVCDFPTLICDNYDEYNTGALGPQADHWSTWSGNVGGDEDGIVTTDQAQSAPNSMYIGDTGAQDVLLLLGNKDAGKYTLEMDVYIPAGKGGYFNVQDDEIPGLAWNLEIWFNVDNTQPGVGSFAATNPTVTFGYPEDEWFHLRMDIDLDNPNMWFWANGELVFDDYVFPGNIGSLDFFSGDDNNNAYFDNIVYYVNPAVTVEELAALKDFKLYPNPNNGSFTISSADFGGTYLVEMIDITGRVVYSENVNISQNETKVVNTNNLNTGVYILRMVDKSTNEAFTTRVSIY